MCRRPIHGPEGLVAVVDHLDQILPRGKRLHLFGVKGEALPYLTGFAHRIASIESQAYGVSARISARRQGRSKTISFVARSEEHTSELQSLMRTSYAVFCLKKTKQTHTI